MHNTTQTDRRILWQKNEIGIARTSNARVRKNLCLTISETRKKIRPDAGSYLLRLELLLARYCGCVSGKNRIQSPEFDYFRVPLITGKLKKAIRAISTKTLIYTP
jgi:hypothetical protein